MSESHNQDNPLDEIREVIYRELGDLVNRDYLIDAIAPIVDDLERERDHWESEHAALFSAIAGDGAAIRIAKAFGGYDDLEWQRLVGLEHEHLKRRAQRVVDMLLARDPDPACGPVQPTA